MIVKFKPEVTDDIKEEALKDILALKNTIPQITDISAGKNFTDRGKGYEYGNVYSHAFFTCSASRAHCLKCIGWVIEIEKKEVCVYT